MFKENNRFFTDWMKAKDWLIYHLVPNWEDPSWGHYSEIGLAGSIANISVLIADKGLSARVFELSRQMARTAGEKLITDWDEPDICPPYRPHHWLWGEIADPSPEPWQEISAAEQIGIAYLLTKFSALTPSATYNKELKSLAAEIVAGVDGELSEEFEKCGTVPRPLPKHLQLGVI